MASATEQQYLVQIDDLIRPATDEEIALILQAKRDDVVGNDPNNPFKL